MTSKIPAALQNLFDVMREEHGAVPTAIRMQSVLFNRLLGSNAPKGNVFTAFGYQHRGDFISFEVEETT